MTKKLPSLAYLHRLAPVLAMAGISAACAVSSETPSGETATTDEAITGGQLINNKGDAADVSSMFPLSTVTLLLSNGTSGGWFCTGEMLSSIQILTAAHCTKPGTGTGLVTVYQYNTAPGNAAPASQSNYTTNSPTPLLPDGVTGTGYGAQGNDSTGNYADLALFTLPAPLPLPVTPTIPGLPGSYGDVRTGSLWQVGSGLINGQPNPQNLMEWVPLASKSPTDTGGTFSALNPAGQVPGNPGDSGGPVYELFGSALLIVGVDSWHDTVTHFVSVVSTTNRNWIMNHYVAPPSPMEIQRGRELIEPSGRAPGALSTSYEPIDREVSAFRELLPD